VVLTQTASLLNHLKPLLCYVMLTVCLNDPSFISLPFVRWHHNDGLRSRPANQNLR